MNKKSNAQPCWLCKSKAETSLTGTYDIHCSNVSCLNFYNSFLIHEWNKTFFARKIAETGHKFNLFAADNALITRLEDTEEFQSLLTARINAQNDYADYIKIIEKEDSKSNDPDLEPIGPGHVCKHHIRWPHECKECADAAYTEEKNKMNKIKNAKITISRKRYELLLIAEKAAETARVFNNTLYLSGHPLANVKESDNMIQAAVNYSKAKEKENE